MPFLPVTLGTPTGTAGTQSWSVTGTLPSGTNLPQGRYEMRAYAVDAASNSSTLAISSFCVGVKDTTAPVVTVNTPTAQSQGVSGGARGLIEIKPGGLTSVSGTVKDPDNADGSPGVGTISYIIIALTRTWSATIEYWNGTTWTSRYSPFNATLGAPDATGERGLKRVVAQPDGQRDASGSIYAAVQHL